MLYLFFKFTQLNFIDYLFLTVLDFHCSTWSFSSCGEQVLLFIAVGRLFIAVTSLVEQEL